MKLSHTLNINEEELEKLKDNKLFIQICFNKEITDLSHLFEDSDFYACPDIHKINTRYISNMSHMFNNCTSLVVKPDLSQINLENIIHVDMFSNCTNLDKFKNPQKLKMLEIKSVKNLYSDNLDSSPKKIKLKYESKNYLFDNIENEIDRDSQYSEGRYPNKDLVESLDCYGCDNKSDSILSSNNCENRTKNPSPIGSNSSITYKSPSETSYNFKDECKYLYEISLRKNYHAYKIIFKENSNYSDNSKRRNNTDGLKKVDEELLRLAKEARGAILTIDFNLIKVAKAEKIQTLNINDLALATRGEFMPGEKATIKILEKGSGRGQGVGHLKDGTMVVVDKAANKIGREITVEFVKFYETPAGKMIFAKMIKKG